MMKRELNLNFVDGSIATIQEFGETEGYLVSPFHISLDEVASTYAFNERRRALFGRLKAYMELVWESELPPVGTLLGGSFLDDGEWPGDIDLVHFVIKTSVSDAPLFYDRKFVRSRFSIDVSAHKIGGSSGFDVLSLLRIGTYYGRRPSDNHQRATIFLMPPQST